MSCVLFKRSTGRQTVRKTEKIRNFRDSQVEFVVPPVLASGELVGGGVERTNDVESDNKRHNNKRTREHGDESGHTHTKKK